MGFNLLPKEEKFFHYFHKQADIIIKTAKIVKDLFTNFENTDEKIREIEALEHEGDILIREITQKLNITFITPLEREDIYELASVLDDIIDYMKAAAIRVSLFKVKETRKPASQMAQLIYDATLEIKEALVLLEKLKDVSVHAERVKELENRGDTLNRNAIAELFDNQVPVIDIIKWKEIYERLENSLDKCEDTVLLVEGILLKHA